MIKFSAVDHAEHIEDVVGLFNVVWGGMSSESWRWKHLENPALVSVPQIIVALDGGKIVGANCFMPVKMALNSGQYLALQSCDTMVHPDYRGKGIFSGILEYSEEYFKNKGYSFFYGFPNQNSFRGFVKQGWQQVFPVETFVSLLRPENIIAQLFSSKLTVKVLTTFYNALNAFSFRGKELNKMSIDLFDSYQSEMAVIEEWGYPNRLNIKRDSSFFRWRIDANPSKEYSYVLFKKEGSVVGYSILNVYLNSKGLKVGTIVDCMFKDDAPVIIGEVIARSLTSLYEMGADIALTWSAYPSQFDNRIRCGFDLKSTNSFPYNRRFGSMSLMVKKIDANLDLLEQSLWAVSPIYTDTI